MLEKRITVSPPTSIGGNDVLNSMDLTDGKLPQQFVVHVMSTIFEDGAQRGKATCEQVRYRRCLDGEWRRDGGFRDDGPDKGQWVQSDAGRPADIEKALQAAEAKTQAIWAEQVKHHGVVDHVIGAHAEKGGGTLVRYAPSGDGWDVAVTKLDERAG